MSKKTMTLLNNAIPIFSLLADETRQKILINLFDKGEKTVSELTEIIKLSQPNTSHHLKLLKSAGLVSVRKEGKERLYDVNLEKSLTQLEEITQSLRNDIKLKRENNNENL